MGNKPTLDRKIKEIEEASNSLDEFENGIKNLIKDIFICLIDKDKQTPVKDVEFEAISSADLLVVTFWNKNFSEGRIVSFLVREKNKETDLENLADLNLQVFGRGTTINERLLSFAENHLDQDHAQLRIDIKIGDFLKCKVSDDGKATIEIGKNIWEKLWNIAKPDNEYFKFRQSILKERKQLSDGARTTRHIYGPELRKERLKAIVDNWAKFSKDKGEKEFFKLLYETTLYEEIVRYRQNQGFIKEEEKEKKKERGSIKFSDLSLGLDFELVDEFASFLQALAHFYPKTKHIMGICKPPNAGYPGHSVYFLSKGTQNINEEVFKNMEEKLVKVNSIIYISLSTLIEKINKKNEKNKEKKTENNAYKYQDKLQAALNKLNHELKTKIDMVLEEKPALQNLLNVIGLISSKVHEGRKLTFTFLYGGGTSWRVIEEILSEEENQSYQKEITSHEDFAKIIEIHWSIFQGDRVAGFIDAIKRKAFNGIGIPFTKIVKLKPYHTLPGPLFKKCVQLSHDSLIIYTSGNGIVRVFFYDKHKEKGIELFRWDTVNNKIEEQSVEIDKITDDILKLIPLGEEL